MAALIFAHLLQIYHQTIRVQPQETQPLEAEHKKAGERARSPAIILPEREISSDSAPA